ncbi:retrovirus-related pol polyprotein from transposon TNT 1-94 [Tanacetum coccineum]
MGIGATTRRNGDDQVERYHARLVVKGYAQKEGINLNEIFSPVVRMTTVRVVLAMCATYDLHLEQLDVKTAFLHGNLQEEIYILQPEGFKQKGKENLVCRLNKSLYGIKQAPQCWYKRFDSFIRSLEYNRLLADPCAYFKSPNKNRINKLKAQLAREFEMKDLGPANKILGMQIHRDRVSRKIWLSQKSYVKKILQRFNMQDCKPILTPFPTDVKLSSKMSPSSEKERMEMSRVPYASAVGSLMFAMICTRPDIAHAVGVVSRYMAEPGRGHWEAVKRILRYIKGTSDVALCFGDSDLIVTGYVDSDYAGDLDGSKSTTGYVFTLSGGTVSWVSKLQSVVAMSTTEAEYVAAAQASKEAVWLKMLLEELGYKQEKITLFCDNQSALYLARNPTFHSKTKHIRVQYHFVREKVEEGTVDMQKIHTDDNVADYLTKAINAGLLELFAAGIAFGVGLGLAAALAEPALALGLAAGFFFARANVTVFAAELVHSDVWQAPALSLGGSKYFVSFIDDYSRRCWVYPIKKKSDVFEVFKVYKARVELDSGKKIKCLRTDNGGEYTGDEFETFCRQEGIKRQFTTAYTPQQNGVAERMNRTLLERARAMLATASLGKSFWAEAVNTTCYVINHSPSNAVELKTPIEI